MSSGNENDNEYGRDRGQHQIRASYQVREQNSYSLRHHDQSLAKCEYQVASQGQYFTQPQYQVETQNRLQRQTHQQEQQVDEIFTHERIESPHPHYIRHDQTRPDGDALGNVSSITSPSRHSACDLSGRKKYRPLLSRNSSESSRSSRSGHIFGQSPIDDPTFAPPPIRPFNMEVSDTTKDKSITSNLPSYDMVKHSGNVMARISLKSLFFKKWKQVFWIAYGDHRIIFFRCKTDFNEWALNPYLTEDERWSLVKLSVDLKNDMLKPGVRCYRVSSLQKKNYGRSGLMHTFKLEQWMYYGPIIMGAFASNSRTETRCLLIVLKEMIKREKNGLTDFLSDAGSIHYDSNDHGHGVRSSFSTRSAPNLVLSR